MIYEMRTYEAMPGKLRPLVRRFGEITHAMFLQYGFRPVGYWTEAIGDNTKLHYMLAWEDDAERVSKWATFIEAPERIAAFAETERDGLLVAKITSALWQITDFSPNPVQPELR